MASSVTRVASLDDIRSAVLAFAETVPAADLFPTVVAEASGYAVNDPFAFCLATCLDRGMKADVIWTIPWDLERHLGHLDPRRIASMSIDEIDTAIRSLKRRPRYMNAAPRTIHEIATLVTRDYGGDASRIWRGRSAKEVRATFESVYGVGPGIASMAVLLIEKAFPDARFSDLDRPGMDIKPDVHTMRVLARLGVTDKSSEGAAVAAARRVNPADPGALDGALWRIGRQWCKARDPECPMCVLREVCATASGGLQLAVAEPTRQRRGCRRARRTERSR